MGFSDTPWGHFIIGPIAWVTGVVYTIMMISIFRERRLLFRNAYIPLFITHSITDFLLFLQAELMSQPRKYNWFNLFNADMTLFAQCTFFYGSFVRYAFYVGHVVCAFNRFTVLKFPIYHDKIWSPFVILLFVGASWWIASLFVIPGFLLYASDIKFTKNSGGIGMSGGRYVKFDSFYGAFLTYSCLAACIFFYVYCFVQLPKISLSKKSRAERRILICAAFSFLPFLLGTARGLLAYVSESLHMPELWTVSNDLWFYDTELTFCAHTWINILMLKQVRESVLRLVKGRPAVVHSQTSMENKSYSTTRRPGGVVTVDNNKP